MCDISWLIGRGAGRFFLFWKIKLEVCVLTKPDSEPGKPEKGIGVSPRPSVHCGCTPLRGDRSFSLLDHRSSRP